ncbi:MAG: hypothetical protein QNI95_16625 [Desulfobacterales bacterium]|nr:hypothetical protein [Desulfobacterales bacterium]
MASIIHIALFGSLTKKFGPAKNAPITLKLNSPLALSAIIKKLEIPQDLVQLVMVNYRAVGIDTLIEPGDRVALFPREYPLFVDWKDFRVKTECSG